MSGSFLCLIFETILFFIHIKLYIQSLSEDVRIQDYLKIWDQELYFTVYNNEKYIFYAKLSKCDIFEIKSM